MKILITGGLGFLGSHSIEKYKSEGFKITIIDVIFVLLFITGYFLNGFKSI